MLSWVHVIVSAEFLPLSQFVQQFYTVGTQTDATSTNQRHVSGDLGALLTDVENLLQLPGEG